MIEEARAAARDALREAGFDAGPLEPISAYRGEFKFGRYAFLATAGGARAKARVFADEPTAAEQERLRAGLEDAFTPVLARHGRALVEPWIEGAPMDESESDRRLAEAGALLGRLHARAPVESGDPAPWLKAAERDLRALVDGGAIDPGHAAELSRKLEAQAPDRFRPSLIHRDFCAENFVVDCEGRLRVIDNEWMAIGPAEYDLGRTRHRWPLEAGSWSRFLAAYRESGPAAEAERFWDLAATLFGARSYLRLAPERLPPVLERLPRRAARRAAGGAGVIVAFCAEGVSHVRTLLAPVAAISRRGLEAHVFTGEELRDDVERAGVRFVDLYAEGTPGELDDSIPIPSRNVTFAAERAEEIAERVAALNPTLILYESFCVVAEVVARLLDLPYVNVSPNHDLVSARAIPARMAATEIAISDRCMAAVERLRSAHGIAEASAFYYLAAHSPHLNLYPEPEEFLPASDRQSFEPLAFFGSLEPQLHTGGEHGPRPPGEPTRILVSFGTIIWRYLEAEAVDALETVVTGLASAPSARVTVSLGGHRLPPPARARLAELPAEVVDYVDHRAVLPEVDVLVTHHGLNSTHEAIYHEVPMLSHPFYGDQPSLAARCAELGLAVPLVRAGEAVEPGRVAAALERVRAERDGFSERLARARSWEVRTIGGRGEIVERMLALSGPRR